MKTNISFEKISLNEGFWKEKQEMVRKQTIHSVYQRFLETGRIDAFRCNANPENEVHFFWDSDVAKWIESVAYITQKSRDATLEAMADEIIDLIEKNQLSDGYFNSYFIVKGIDQRFTQRRMHELYCAGHLIEAAVAYKRATGKEKLYGCMLRYVDYIDRIFRVEKKAGFITPGHQEIELALMKLYRESGEQRHLELAKFFIDARGGEQERAMTNMSEDRYEQEYSQDHFPVREQETAQGHAVRLLYMCAAMADVALECRDEALKKACENIFEDLVRKKMYITGGIGSNSNNEGFDIPWNLPNEHAYNETCASIAMCLFARRMQLLSNDSKYADVIEKELYNGILSGISLDGKAFFYENPLEIRLAHLDRLNSGVKQKLNYPLHQRAEVFQCSCCPPNLTRLIPSVGDYLYSADSDTVWFQQYMSSELHVDGMRIVQNTDYPSSGEINIRFYGKTRNLALRLPDWCNTYSLYVNGKCANEVRKQGYLYVAVSDGDQVMLQLDMTPFKVEAAPRILEDVGKIAIQRGPVIYCAEAVDNLDVLMSDFRATGNIDILLTETVCGLPMLKIYGEGRNQEMTSRAYDRVGSFPRVAQAVHMIPYFAFANRGKSDMQVWLLS